MRIGITGLIMVATMLAMMAPSASAFAVDTLGQIEFENGTPCPAGWTVCEENLDYVYSGEPWCQQTLGDGGGYGVFDYVLCGIAESDSQSVRVFVESPNKQWYGEKTIAPLSSAWNASWMFYVFDLVVQERPCFTMSMPEGWNLFIDKCNTWNLVSFHLHVNGN